MGRFFGGSELGGGNPERSHEIPRNPPLDRSWRNPSLEITEVHEITDRPEVTDVPEILEVPAAQLPPARRFKLTVGKPGSDHVVVEEIKLDSIPRDIVISRSRGVQIGKHNRQLNDYRYELDKPTASIDDVFDGHPIRQWAFEKLADNPNSMIVNFFFRMLLPEGPLYSGGRIGFAETDRREVRITARLGDQGAILVDKSWGIQVGNWNKQRNRFLYKVEQSKFHLETALRDPDIARGLAVAVKYPGSPAAQRSLIRRLQGTSDRSSWSTGDVYTKFSAAIPRPVTGDGVQLGDTGTIRNDKVRIRAGKVILTGWERLGELKADDRERDQRLQESHQSRISASQPPDFVAADTTRAPEDFLPRFIERTATVILNQVAPGRPHLVAGMVEEIKTALDTPEESGNDDDDGGEVSLAAVNGRFGFRGGTVPARLGVQRLEAGLAKGFRREQAGEQAFDLPYLELVEFVGHERRLCQPGGVTTEVTEVVWQQDVSPSGSDSAGPLRAVERQAASDASVPTAPPTNSADDDAAVSAATAAPTEAVAFRDRGRTVVATGAVVCGPLTAITAAMGTRFLDAGLLLAYARKHVWNHRYNGTHQSVASAMRAVQGLQLVVFLDPAIGMGLWVDVDPARQAPAAVLLIEIDLSAGPPGRCRIFPVIARPNLPMMSVR